LGGLSKRFKKGSVEARVISEEAEMLRREFLDYPNPYKFLIVADSYKAGRMFLDEYFLKFRDRQLVTPEGNLIRYGNDFAGSDRDVRNEHSWARRCYSHLFTFDRLKPAIDRQ